MSASAFGVAPRRTSGGRSDGVGRPDARAAEPRAPDERRRPCGRGESNPHARRHQILSLAWLPLHHSRVRGSLGAPPRPSATRSGRLSPVPRSPEQIQQEIDAARESLAATLDDLAFRTSPQRLSDQAKQKALAFLQSPPGLAIAGAVGLTVTFVVTRRIVRRVRR